MDINVYTNILTCRRRCWVTRTLSTAAGGCKATPVLRGAVPPVDLRALWEVLAILNKKRTDDDERKKERKIDNDQSIYKNISRDH